MNNIEIYICEHHYDEPVLHSCCWQMARVRLYTKLAYFTVVTLLCQNRGRNLS